MLGRQHQIRGAKDGVRTRREHPNVQCARGHFTRRSGNGHGSAAVQHHVLNGEDHVRPLRLPDPVALRRFGALRPIEPVQVREQPSGVVSDPEEPLFQEALFHYGTAPLARAGNDLLIGEHGLVHRTPVHGGLLLVGQTLFVELQKDPLRPLVVGWIRGGQLMRPINHQPGAL